MKHAEGSALLMVIFVTTIITTAVTTTWYTASLLHDASLVRQQALQRMQAVQGLLVYATVHVTDYDGPAVLYGGPWSCGDGGLYYGYAVSSKEPQGIKVQAELKQKGRVVATLSSYVT